MLLSQCLDLNLALSLRVIGAQTVWPSEQEACAVSQYPAQRQQQRVPPSENSH